MMTTYVPSYVGTNYKVGGRIDFVIACHSPYNNIEVTVFGMPNFSGKWIQKDGHCTVRLRASILLWTGDFSSNLEPYA